jgi:hypothetical protein
MKGIQAAFVKPDKTMFDAMAPNKEWAQVLEQAHDVAAAEQESIATGHGKRY